MRTSQRMSGTYLGRRLLLRSHLPTIKILTQATTSRPSLAMRQSNCRRWPHTHTHIHTLAKTGCWCSALWYPQALDDEKNKTAKLQQSLLAAAQETERVKERVAELQRRCEDTNRAYEQVFGEATRKQTRIAELENQLQVSFVCIRKVFAHSFLFPCCCVLVLILLSSIPRMYKVSRMRIRGYEMKTVL